MVACHKFILMEERITYTSTISKSKAVIEFSYAVRISDESIHAIVDGS